MVKNHTLKGAGYWRLFIKRKVTPLRKPTSCNELGNAILCLLQVGKTRFSVQGSPNRCLWQQSGSAEAGKERGDSKNFYSAPSSARKQLVAAPGLNHCLFVYLLGILKTDATGTSAELRLHHKQSSGTSEGFPWDNDGFWWEMALPSAGVGGTITQLTSLPL